MVHSKKRTPARKGTELAKRTKVGLPVREQPPAKIVIQEGTLTKLVLRGDLSGLTEQETVQYYMSLCSHLGLDPVTRPFDLLVLNGKKVLYAHKGCTDQLRMKYGVSVTDLRGEVLADCYRVTALGQNAKGRTDAATGVVKVKGLTGDAYANAVMKAETKAKRRLTLSLCGLGMLDETEIETIPGAATVNLATGELNGKEQVYDIDPEKPLTEEQKKTKALEQARADLNDVFHKIQASKLFTTDEIAAHAKLAVGAKDDENSLIDLQAAWIDELSGRQRGEKS